MKDEFTLITVKISVKEAEMLKKIQKELNLSQNEAIDRSIKRYFDSTHLEDHLADGKGIVEIKYNMLNNICNSFFIRADKYETDTEKLVGACISAYAHNQNLV